MKTGKSLCKSREEQEEYGDSKGRLQTVERERGDGCRKTIENAIGDEISAGIDSAACQTGNYKREKPALFCGLSEQPSDKDVFAENQSNNQRNQKLYSCGKGRIRGKPGDQIGEQSADCGGSHRIRQREQRRGNRDKPIAEVNISIGDGDFN